jgi:hypothetical protein
MRSKSAGDRRHISSSNRSTSARIRARRSSGGSPANATPTRYVEIGAAER